MVQLKYFGMVITKDNDRVFMLRRAAKHSIGKWEFPCGKGDLSETPIQSAAREFGEETGHIIRVQDLRLGMSFMAGQISDPSQNIMWQNDVYLLDGRHLQKELKVAEPNTHDLCKWVLIKDLPKMTALGHVADMSAVPVPWLVLMADSLPG